MDRKEGMGKQEIIREEKEKIRESTGMRGVGQRINRKWKEEA